MIFVQANDDATSSSKVFVCCSPRSRSAAGGSACKLRLLLLLLLCTHATYASLFSLDDKDSNEYVAAATKICGELLALEPFHFDRSTISVMAVALARTLILLRLQARCGCAARTKKIEGPHH